jgi:hypothetical protein
MQIFVLDKDPTLAAQFHCDKHVLSQIVEATQLLCSVYPPGTAPYKRTHYNHPSAVWTRTSQQNFDWLVRLACALLNEYCIRYGKIHKTSEVIDWILHHNPSLPCTGLTDFPQCMPEECRIPGSYVEAYRKYYMDEKAAFATWKTNKPYWWI